MYIIDIFKNSFYSYIISNIQIVLKCRQICGSLNLTMECRIVILIFIILFYLYFVESYTFAIK